MVVAFIVAALADAVQTRTDSIGLYCTAAALRSSNVPVAEVQGLTFAVAEPDTLKFVYAEEFEHPCASVIRKSVMGAVQLTDGRSFQKNGNEAFAPRDADPFEDAYDERTPTDRLLPKVDGAALLSSARVNSRRIGGDFVGVWHVGAKWLVQSFSQREDGSFTAPRIVLTSSLPIRSVMYFPGPDTPSGRLEMLQEQRNGKVRNLALDWWHRSAFARR